MRLRRHRDLPVSLLPMNEESLIKRACLRLPNAANVLIGPGDDCAMIADFPARLVAADQVIQGVHFTPDTSPEAVAVKLLRRNLSDIAAMGGTPRDAVDTVAIRLGSSEEETLWLDAFFIALGEEAQRWQVNVVGGDISVLPAPGIVATLTIMGDVNEHAVARRSGARPGDLLFVTGCLGNSFKSGHHLNFLPRLGEGRFLCDHRFATAMIDISDGLVSDLLRLSKASGCGVEINPDALPLRDGASLPNALHDGEDYELLFAVQSDRADGLVALWPFDHVPLTCIGRFIPESPCVRTPDGHTLSPRGWDPFVN